MDMKGMNFDPYQPGIQCQIRRGLGVVGRPAVYQAVSLSTDEIMRGESF